MLGGGAEACVSSVQELAGPARSGVAMSSHRAVNHMCERGSWEHGVKPHDEKDTRAVETPEGPCAHVGHPARNERCDRALVSVDQVRAPLPLHEIDDGPALAEHVLDYARLYNETRPHEAIDWAQPLTRYTANQT